jgi:hypothetical protein
LLIIIFTNYALLVSILKKLNLRLVYAREYLFKFLLLIWYKLSKVNFILDTLFKLLIVDNLKLEAINNIVKISLTKGKLDMLFAYNAFIDS